MGDAESTPAMGGIPDWYWRLQGCSIPREHPWDWAGPLCPAKTECGPRQWAGRRTRAWADWAWVLARTPRASHNRRQQHGNHTSGCAKRFKQERASYCQPESGKERDGHIKRQIWSYRLHRLTGRVDHGDIRAMNACRKPGLFHLFQHAQIELVVAIGLLPHIGVFGGGLVLLHIVGGVLGQAFARQLLTIGGRLPGALKLIHQPRVFSRDLSVEVLQLAANLHHSGKVRPMLDASTAPAPGQAALWRAWSCCSNAVAKSPFSSCRWGSEAITSSGFP